MAVSDATVGETDTAKLVEMELDLDELIEIHEDVDWQAVPGVSTAEAATWTQRLIEARAELLDGEKR